MKAILTYHSIDESGSIVSIAPATFRRQMEWLARSDVSVVSVGTLLSLPAGATAVSITFDDAFRNFAGEAWPVLRDHGLPVTLFVPSAHVGGRNAWSATDRRIPDLPIADWDTLARVVTEGVEIGSHTMTHADLAGLDDTLLHDELAGAAEAIEERLGVRPRGFAYPYGSFDAAAERAAGRLYAWACTADLGLVTAAARPHRLPRVDAYYLQGEGRLESWGTGRLRLYLQARAGARRCRRLLEHAGLA